VGSFGLRISFVGIHAPRHLGAPLVYRLEARLLARLGLRPFPKLVVRQLHVHRDAQRLLHVPRRVDEELDAIAFGIMEVDRQRVAVRGGIELLHLLGDHAPVHLAQPRKFRHAE
jgi:hypothetical protein